MKITETSTTRIATTRPKRPAGAASGTFADMLEAPGSAAAGAAAPLSAVSSPNMLLAQEINEEEARRRKTVKQGHDMLDSLERLRSALLSGVLPPETLRNMERQLALHREQVSDPALHALMDEIELRLAVELAKIDKALEDMGNQFDAPR